MISLERLCAGYRGVARVQDVSLSLRPGALLGIVGPNGSGKSTLLKATAGLLRPLSGCVLCDGEDMARLSPRARAAHIAYMPQNRGVPELTVSQLAAHGRYAHMGARRVLTEQDRRIVRAALERTGAYAFRDALLGELSGGERQRAYLSLLLSQDAPCLLLDEPTAFLDPGAQLSLTALLRELAGERRAVAVVLHDLPLALSCCDALAVMSGGRLIAQAVPGEEYTARILQDVFGVRVIPAQEPGVYALAGRVQREA